MAGDSTNALYVWWVIEIDIDRYTETFIHIDKNERMVLCKSNKSALSLEMIAGNVCTKSVLMQVYMQNRKVSHKLSLTTNPQTGIISKTRSGGSVAKALYVMCNVPS